MYITYNQGFPQPNRICYELRTAGDPMVYVNTVREIVHQADSLVPLAAVRSQVQEIDQTINQEIIFAELCTAFAILALVMPPASGCTGRFPTTLRGGRERSACAWRWGRGAGRPLKHPSPGSSARRIRPGDRRASSFRSFETGRVVFVWNETQRSVGADRGGRDPSSCGDSRRLRPGAKGVANRSHGRAAARGVPHRLKRS